MAAKMIHTKVLQQIFVESLESIDNKKNRPTEKGKTDAK